MGNEAFSGDLDGLRRSIDLLVRPHALHAELPVATPVDGIGPGPTLELLSGSCLSGGRDLGAPGFFAHMDPPTPWITWAMQLWAARLNQNLLHPDTAPIARDLERRVVEWFAPIFGMGGGHMTPGSTLANLTALWAAREAGAAEVVAGANAHLSIAKGAHLLGMPYRVVEDWAAPGDLSRTVAVLTAGTTSTGEIEPLDAAASADWRHVDAAWAGPLRLSHTHRHLLDGIEGADSVSVSAHKWLFQPKESAMVLFQDVEASHDAISFCGEYLAVPNIGIQGSHGATALPLAATVLAYGTSGIASWIDAAMRLADELWDIVEADPDLEALSKPQTGVLNWRHKRVPVELIVEGLPASVLVSSTAIAGERWLRSVAANPMADPVLVAESVLSAAAR